jgi:transposase, IS30 family
LPVKTITYDNGCEFNGHMNVAESLSCKTYFAKPYHSWERGTNENTNGFIRQYFPKGSDLQILKEVGIQHAMSRINNRPKEVLGYKSPTMTAYGSPHVAIAS